MLRFGLIVICFGLFSVNFLQSQNWNRILDYELEAEHYMYIGSFDEAASIYKTALRLVPNSSNIKFKIGFCYLQSPNKRELALEYLEDAAQNVSDEYDYRSIQELKSPAETFYHLGVAYQIAGRWDDAKNAYTRFLEVIDRNNPHRRAAEQRLASLVFTPEAIEQKRVLQVENLGNTINNKRNNFNAVFSGDGSTMAYTSIERDAYQVYVSKKQDNGEWGRPRRITNDLRANYLKTTSLSFSGDELYLVDELSQRADIYHSTLEGRTWSRAKRMKRPIRSRHNETHAFISDDGKTLYFTSDRPGGYGGLDIYKSTLSSRGKWDTPVNLGPNINTEFNENTPFMSIDGYLFFSSEGHNSMGGYDIFYVDIDSGKKPVNLGYPLNDASDNLFFFPLASQNGFIHGYKSMYVDGGFGPSDIYDVKIRPLINVRGMFANIEDYEKGLGEDVLISVFDINKNKIDTLLNANLFDRNFNFSLVPGVYKVSVTGQGFKDFETNISIPSDFTVYSQDLSVNLEAIVAPPLLADDEGQIIKVDVPIGEPEPEEETLIETPSDYEGQFTVQIMALIVPRDLSYFGDISGLSVSQDYDGFYRYTVGLFETIERAKEEQHILAKQGYPDAFVRQLAGARSQITKQTSYIIQFMALKNRVDINLFSDIDNVIVLEGDDGFFRYSTQGIPCYDSAKMNLAKVRGLGYKDAFIARIELD